MRDAADLDARAVVLQAFLQPPLDQTVIAAFVHVDEVDHDEAGQIAQAQLPRDFLGRFEIGLGAVSSMWCSRVARPEFTSIATSASVWLITM